MPKAMGKTQAVSIVFLVAVESSLDQEKVGILSFVSGALDCD